MSKRTTFLSAILAKYVSVMALKNRKDFPKTVHISKLPKNCETTTFLRSGFFAIRVDLFEFRFHAFKTRFIWMKME
jgi:hypothetical protein